LASKLWFSIVLNGAGTAWADDLQVLVDGKPLPDRPWIDRESDHEFDHGSHIGLSDLTSLQIDNLVTLGKVWGFLKYYHPQITAGRRQWDYDLFRVMPAILEAHDRSEANNTLLHWIYGLDDIGKCDSCASLESRDNNLSPQLDWIFDHELLGVNLSQRLLSIRDNRPADGKRYYASGQPGLNRLSFDHELDYGQMKIPDAGFQLLALYRFWNVIRYWSPYRDDVMKEDWDLVLSSYIPRMALAKDAITYQRELAALIASAHDTNANLWNALEMIPPVGACQLPVNLRFLNAPSYDQVVVVGYSAESGHLTGLKRGDIVIEIDGKPLSQILPTITRFYAASNQSAQFRDIARYLTRGDCIPTTLRIRRDGEELTIITSRTPTVSLDLSTGATHDLRGPAFRMLSSKVAYLKLSAFKASEVRSYIEAAANTLGLIIDLRNYPAEPAVFELGQHLIDNSREFARFTTADLSNAGRFQWSGTAVLNPKPPRYLGKVVILVDEITQGQAEFAAMAFRTVPGSLIIGDTTSGAVGNMLPISMPGGLRSSISGNGVFYPDKKPTQSVGILPDFVVRPTVAGVRTGRDEILELALRQILGPEVPAAAIEQLI
jgi:C-terminal processing protease CtpA/Prc